MKEQDICTNYDLSLDRLLIKHFIEVIPCIHRDAVNKSYGYGYFWPGTKRRSKTLPDFYQTINNQIILYFCIQKHS